MILKKQLPDVVVDKVIYDLVQLRVHPAVLDIFEDKENIDQHLVGAPVVTFVAVVVHLVAAAVVAVVAVVDHQVSKDQDFDQVVDKVIDHVRYLTVIGKKNY